MAKNIDTVVGERIAAARRRRGWYQRDLAAAIGMSESWVSQIERGVLPLDSLEAAEKIATELRLDVPHVLALDVRYQFAPPEAAVRPSPAAGVVAPAAAGEDWLTVLRRMFMVGAGGLLGEALTGMAPSSFAGAGGRRSALDSGTMADLSAVSAAYRRAYRAVPSESLLQLAIGQVRLAFSLAPGSQPEPVRTHLVRHAGQMAVLAGVVQMLDLGNFGQAEPLLRLAASAAKAIDDRELTAVVYGCRAFHSGYSGDLDEGLDWAQAGQDVAASGASPRTTAWVSAVASEMHASLGNRDSCVDALDTARAALQRPEQDERWSGIGWLDEAKVDAYEGGDLMRLGDYDAAIERLSMALDALDAGMVRHRSTALVDRADALAASGEVEAACRDAEEALDSVARVHHAETLRRIGRVHKTVRTHRSQAVRALGQHLMDVRASLPAAGRLEG